VSDELIKEVDTAFWRGRLLEENGSQNKERVGCTWMKVHDDVPDENNQLTRHLGREMVVERTGIDFLLH
jgi:hypothetical protein